MRKMASSKAVPFCSLLVFFLIDRSLVMPCSQPLAPALYVFGDSLFDSGNNNVLPTLAKANYLPYGVNFARGVTGRFTNGRTVADFIAELLGLPYPPPYLGALRPPSRTGLNYASGSCGIISDTGSPYGRCLNVAEQMNMFERTVDVELPAILGGSNATLDHLSKSIFIFAIGSNDYITNYLSKTSPTIAPQPFAQYLVNQLSLSLRRLYHKGARKIVVFEIGPIGCIPSIAARQPDRKGCMEEANYVVSFFNAELEGMLQRLRCSLHGSIFVHGRANALGYDAITNPSSYGFTDTSNPCCRTWANGTSGCIPMMPSCTDPEKHFFFDAFHMTEAPCSLIATRCFSNSSVCSPTLKDLALN